jgi:hypothetical protein
LTLLAAAQIALGIFCLIRFNADNSEFKFRIEDDVSRMFVDYESDPEQLDSTQQWVRIDLLVLLPKLLRIIVSDEMLRGH